MQYRNYGKLGWKVSAFGMGCMRLPRKDDGTIDRDQACEMICYAVDHGVNYFDTGHHYHSGTSEEVLGEALGGGLREKVKIETKQAYFEMADLKLGGGATIYDNARRNLEITLKKLRTDYIDVYLMHALNKESFEAIKKLDIVALYEKFRSEGLIKAIGFSFHDTYPVFQEILNFYNWDVCLIQQNLLNVAPGEDGVYLAGKKGCALVIMEPLFGGRLANPPEIVQKIYNEYKTPLKWDLKNLPFLRKKNGEISEKRNAIEWAFRYLINYSQISCVLSGVSTLDQLKEGIAIFSRQDAVPHCLSKKEKNMISRVRKAYKSLPLEVSCTECWYCCPCPQGVKIPIIFSFYNYLKMYNNSDYPRRAYYLHVTRKEGDGSRCTACGICEKKCPQNLNIIENIKAAHEVLKGFVE